MKQKLFHLYNRLKKSFVDEITDIVNHKGGEIVFEPFIKIWLPSGESDSKMFEYIACLKYDENEKCLYTNIETVELDDDYIDRHEYWVPLRDMSFDEMFKIAESI